MPACRGGCAARLLEPAGRDGRIGALLSHRSLSGDHRRGVQPVRGWEGASHGSESCDARSMGPGCPALCDALQQAATATVARFAAHQCWTRLPTPETWKFDQSRERSSLRHYLKFDMYRCFNLVQSRALPFSRHWASHSVICRLDLALGMSDSRDAPRASWATRGVQTAADQTGVGPCQPRAADILKFWCANRAQRLPAVRKAVSRPRMNVVGLQPACAPITVCKQAE